MRVLVISHQKIWRQNFVRYSSGAVCVLSNVEFVEEGQNIDVVLIDAQHRKTNALFDLIDLHKDKEIYLVSNSRDMAREIFSHADVRGVFDSDIAIRDIVNFLSARDPQNENIKERLILDSLVQGLSNKEISFRYDLPLSTVKYCLSNIYSEMNVRNRTQAALLHGKSGL